MDTQSKISTGQFFSLLLLSRLLSTLTFMPSYIGTINTSDCLLAVSVGSALIPLFCIPVFILFNNKQRHSILDEAYTVSPVFSKIVSVIYVILFVYYAFITLVRMNLFVATIVFPDMNTSLFVIVSVAAVCYAASLGLEPLGRAGTVSLTLFCASFVVILLTLINKVDMNYLSSVLYDGVSSPLEVASSVVIRTIEPAAIAVLIPRINGNLKKGFAVWIISYFVIVTTIFFFLMTTLGNSAFLQMFPVHGMAVLSELGLFERLDIVLTGVWIISAFIKIGFMIYLSADLLGRSFKREYKNYYIAAIGLLLIILLYFESISMTSLQYVTSLTARGIMFAAVVVVLPSAVLVASMIKKRVKK